MQFFHDRFSLSFSFADFHVHRNKQLRLFTSPTIFASFINNLFLRPIFIHMHTIWVCRCQTRDPLRHNEKNEEIWMKNK